MSRDTEATAELMAQPLAIRNPAFSSAVPGLQIAWDSTSLGLLKECPRKYYLFMVEGWTPRAQSIHLRFGQIYHSALETYDRAKAKGASHDEAARSAIRHALVESWDGDKPWITDDSYKNRLTLLRSVCWYLEQFAEDTLETIQLSNGSPAVELTFRVELEHLAPDGTRFMLSGHLDRLALFQGSPFVCDRKTTKSALDDRFFSGFSPSNQMQIYDLGAFLTYQIPPKGIIIDGAQIAVNFTRFQRGFVHYTSSQREEFYDELGLWFQVAAFYAQKSFWPKNEKACGNYGGCPLLAICSKPPGLRHDWLSATFYHRIWNPLQVRGDI